MYTIKVSWVLGWSAHSLSLSDDNGFCHRLLEGTLVDMLLLAVASSQAASFMPATCYVVYRVAELLRVVESC
jgi:hypothetical protein